ncbi:MAG: YchJ family metal-binding protein [Litorilituus sp.]|nr:YchJ family metal-binding protein [Litorilituus sp.]
MPSHYSCFCGSTLLFEQCCQPFINKEKQPKTPQQLMKSRFSAYAYGHYQYIIDTYAHEKKSTILVEDIEHSSEGCHWIALVIHHSKKILTTTAVNHNYFVEFSAFYIINNTLCEMREKSSFVLEQGQWRYLDGIIIKHDELSKLSRNQICPCNHYPTAWTLSKSPTKAKKYKHCCGK